MKNNFRFLRPRRKHQRTEFCQLEPKTVSNNLGIVSALKSRTKLRNRLWDPCLQPRTWLPKDCVSILRTRAVLQRKCRLFKLAGIKVQICLPKNHKIVESAATVKVGIEVLALANSSAVLQPQNQLPNLFAHLFHKLGLRTRIWLHLANSNWLVTKLSRRISKKSRMPNWFLFPRFTKNVVNRWVDTIPLWMMMKLLNRLRFW